MINQKVSSRLAAVRPHYSVIIIGGGINGCGLFRDLAAQGVDCLLVERGDFCSGASAAPSRLIHGGIKYLETGEFRLVRQSALERNLLLKNAPHYVKPLATVLPVTSLLGGILPSIKRFLRLKAKLNDRGAVITKIGLLLYDLFGRHYRTMPKHRMLRRAAIRATMPDLAENISAAGIYYEARITHAERLGLELLLDGMADCGQAQALNHVAASGDGAGSLILTDQLQTGSTMVHGDIIINAAGAWIDKVNTALGVSTQHMGGNKGSHLIVHNPKLYAALDGRMVYFGTRDGRVNLLYPFMGNVLVGSTDIAVNDPDRIHCTKEEQHYLCAAVAEIFPQIHITPQDIIMTYCGVRPLPNAQGLEAGEVSRDHSIAKDVMPDGRTPVYSLIGGKWTTYRGFSEEVADLVLEILKRPRRCSTRDKAIGGGRDYPQNETQKTRLIDALMSKGTSREMASTLIERYGTRATALIEASNSDGMAALKSLPHYSKAEILSLCRHEMVGRLDDVLFRRSDIALSGHLTTNVIEEIAAIAAPILQWDEARCEKEIAATHETCRAHHIAL